MDIELHQRSASDRWFAWRPPRSDAQVRLFCFPYAGGGSGAFRALAPLLPHEIDLCSVILPGREARIHEPLIHSLAELTPRLAATLQPYLDRPFALLGYSLGAIVAFDLACHLAGIGQQQPSHLFACARRGPAVPSVWPISATDSDEAVVEALMAFGGTPEALFAERELLSMVINIMRADLALNDSFDPARWGSSSVSCPVTAVGGIERSLCKRRGS